MYLSLVFLIVNRQLSIKKCYGKINSSTHSRRKSGRYDVPGNPRAEEADLILAEDTRTTGILLKHFEIQNRMQSHHKFNEHKTVEQVAARIKAGENIALVSDAGTPRYPIRDSC